uniref:Tpk1 n=1 Tax=Arundo donax TaxID=35708 RepID=A0A0A9BMG7_ARUDO
MQRLALSATGELSAIKAIHLCKSVVS